MDQADAAAGPKEWPGTDLTVFGPDMKPSTVSGERSTTVVFSEET